MNEGRGDGSSLNGVLSRLAGWSSRTMVGKTIRLPLRLIPSNWVVPIVAGPMKGLRWRVGASVHGCWLGTYELDEQRCLERIASPGMVAWDLGANAGVYTLLLARIVGPSGAVYAFEPFPKNCVDLLQHVALNKFDNVTLVATAASRREGMHGFLTAPSRSMGTIRSEASGLMVASVSIDGMLADPQIPAPDIVKMDVEGAEADVLMGAATLLAAHRTRWVISLHGTGQTDACERIFRDAGYLVSDLTGKQIDGSVADAGVTDIVATPKAALERPASSARLQT